MTVKLLGCSTYKETLKQAFQAMFGVDLPLTQFKQFLLKLSATQRFLLIYMGLFLAFSSISPAYNPSLRVNAPIYSDFAFINFIGIDLTSFN